MDQISKTEQNITPLTMIGFFFPIFTLFSFFLINEKIKDENLSSYARSTFHLIIAGSVGLLRYYYFNHDTPFLIHAYAGIGITYFIYDLFDILKRLKGAELYMFVVHHLCVSKHSHSLNVDHKHDLFVSLRLSG